MLSENFEKNKVYGGYDIKNKNLMQSKKYDSKKIKFLSKTALKGLLNEMYLTEFSQRFCYELEKKVNAGILQDHVDARYALRIF
jgi:hypothetical protein